VYGLGELLVTGPSKNVLGMSRIRVAYTAARRSGRTCSDFYRLESAQPEALMA